MASPASTTPTVMCRGERFRLFLDEATIQARVRELGRQISADYAGRRPILIGVLNGAFMFLADLMRAIDIDCEVDFLKLSSYGAQKVSSGQVQELKRIDADVRGRDVLIVEDIVDTGLSMHYMQRLLEAHEPASVRTVTLLHKPDATRNDVQLDYVAFEIPNLFVIGYGLDYGQLARNLREIYILDEEATDVPAGD
ncbi:hypoxanthine phosphoribosyltransferase [Rhodothermaceae bacterium RA]|nr:hypoxanthine phosphoribosyltransferase [Rhodothermaceae bacterium RA]